MGNLRKYYVLIASAGIIFIMSSYLIFTTLNIPYIGLSVEPYRLGTWIISNVDNLGWAKQQGIKVGDIVSLVNQNQPAHYVTVRQYGVIEQAKTLAIHRNGVSITYIVTNNQSYKLVMYHIVLPATVFFILFFLSCFLYFKKWDDSSSRILVLFFLAVGFCYLSAGASSRIDWIAIFINRISLLLIPILFLEFIFSYFTQREVHLFNRKLLFPFYLVNCLLFAFDLLFSILGLRLSIIKDSFLIVFSIGILLSLYILISGNIRYRKTVHKPFFKIMATGFTLAFLPFVILNGLPSILFGVKLMPGPLAAVFLICIPVIFFYLITANRLLDIDFVIDRIRYYSILAILPAIFLTGFLMYFMGKEFTFTQRIQVFLFSYIGSIAFSYFKEELDFRIRSRLFRAKYNFQASLDRFSHNIAKVMKKSDLEDLLLSEVKEPVQKALKIE